MRIARLLLLVSLVSPVALAAPAGSLVDDVPDAALAALVIRHNADVMRMMLGKDPALQQDLSAFLVRRLGVDLTRLDGGALWSTNLAQPTFAVLLRVPSTKTLKGTKVGSFDGADLIALGKDVVAAAVPHGVIVGNEQEVRVGIAVAHRHAPAVSAQSPLGALVGGDGNVDLAAAVSVSAMKDPQVQAMAQQYGVKLMTLAVRADGQVRLEVSGDGAKLHSAQTLLQGGAQMALAQLEQAKNRALADEHGDLAEDVGTIAGYHYAASFWKEFQPKLVGDKLVSSYQLPEMKSGTSMLVPMLGAMAAVAVPAFQKYLRRAKSTEATANVRAIADAAAAYAANEAPKRKGKFAFPPSTGWAPARGCCGLPNDKCPPDASAFAGATWTALGYKVDGAHYYQYRVTSEGRGAKAKLTVEAKGDLDCDGKAASFKRVVTLDAQGAPVVSPLESSDDIE